MIYVGIVGGLTPLGQKVINFLQKEKDAYRVVFCVDKEYKLNSPHDATYANVEAALSFNQTPSVVIDCDDENTAIERAKIYRFYAVPAIMCCACEPEALDDLRCSYVAENQKAPSLLITPDYRLNNVRLMSFFLGIADQHLDDLVNLKIEVTLPPQVRINLLRWLYWGKLFNDKLGQPEAKYSVKGNTCNFGNVVIKAHTDDSLAKNNNIVCVALSYGNKQNPCYTHMKTLIKDCLEDSVAGIKLMLKWFKDNPKEIAAGKVFANHLSKVILERKKNLS